MILPKKPEQENQGRGGLLGFFDRAITPNQRTGMSPLMAAAAGLDALILPEMRMGDAIRQQGAQRAKGMAANRTAETLRAQGREDLAKLLLDGGINAQQAISMMQSDKAADLAFKRQQILAAGKAKDTALMRRAEAAGLKPGSDEYKKFMLVGGLQVPQDNRTSQIKNYEYFLAQGKTPDEAAALAKTGDVFNLGGKKPSAFELAQAKKQADQYASYAEGAMAAQDALGNLSVMEQLTSQPGFYSGSMAERVLQVKKAAVALGADPDLVKDEESFMAIARKTALDVMGGSLGVGFSNADRDFVTAMVPGLENTPKGNSEIIRIQRQIQQRRIDLAVLTDQYVEQNGNLSGFTKFVKDWAEKNPLFPKAQTAPGISSNAMQFIKS